MTASRAIQLPGLLQDRVEGALRNLLTHGGHPAIDYSRPQGEAALNDPDSVSWRVFKNPLALFVGGVAAVILELAEPRVRTGVWNHTSFREHPLPRLQRTGAAAMMTVYGPRSQTEAMIAAVGRKHALISGVTPDGQAYRADDPELLDWVHATASFGFLEAYHAYVAPLSDAQRDRFYAEGLTSSGLYGATGAPASQREAEALFMRMGPRLEPSPIVFEFLSIMQEVGLVAPALAPLQRWLLNAAVDIVPGWVRERLGLGRGWQLRGWQRFIVRHGGALGDRLLLTSAPAVQSCRRLGLPDDYLYGRGPEK